MNSTVQLSSSVGWTQTDASTVNTNNTSSDAGQISYQYDYLTGVGTGRMNEVYHQYATLSSGGTGNYNLAALTQIVLGYGVVKTFTEVKGVAIKNYSNVSGANININVTSSSGFKQAFGYPTGELLVEAKTDYRRNSVFGSWPVSPSGPRQIQLVDKGSGASYEITIWGITG